MQCPQCQAPMVPDNTPDERRIIKTMVESGSTAPYAANFAAAVHEKRAALGPVYTCPLCRYVTRVKDAA